MQPDSVGRVGPLRPQRRGRADDHDLLEADGADRERGGERLAGARGGDEQEVRLRVRGMTREKLGLPRPWRDHDACAPFSRLQRGHSAWPFAGSVAPPALTGLTWSPCQPGCSGAPHAAQWPRAAKNRATRALGLNRRASIACSFASRRRGHGEDRRRCRVDRRARRGTLGLMAQTPKRRLPQVRDVPWGEFRRRASTVFLMLQAGWDALRAGARRGAAPDHQVEGPSRNLSSQEARRLGLIAAKAARAGTTARSRRSGR